MTPRLPQVEQRYFIEPLTDTTVFEHRVLLNGREFVGRFREDFSLSFGRSALPPAHRERQIRQQMMAAIENQIYGDQA